MKTRGGELYWGVSKYQIAKGAKVFNAPLPPSLKETLLILAYRSVQAQENLYLTFWLIQL